MILTIGILRNFAEMVAGKAYSSAFVSTNCKGSHKVQFTRLEGGLVQRRKLKAAIIVLKNKSDLRIEVDDHPALGPPMLVFSWTCGPDNRGALRLRLWEDEQLNQWKAA